MSFSLPTGVAAAVRPSASPALLGASAAIAFSFAATPFIVPRAVSDLGVGLGAAGLLSTAQVAGFTLVNVVAGRRLTPDRAFIRWALVVLAIVNVSSIAAPDFSILVITRLLAGGAMGLLTWIAWVDSAADARRKGEIASIGPITTLVAAPVVWWLDRWAGLDGIYLGAAAVTVACLPLRRSVDPLAVRPGRRPIETPGVRPTLVALGGLTLFASSVFVFAGAFTSAAGVGGLGLTLGLMLNSALGIIPARRSRRRVHPGLPVVGMALCVVGLTAGPTDWIVVGSIALWGAMFWLVIPSVFSSLSERSTHPGDRVGDAQGVMALGRVLGPSLGGLVLTSADTTVLTMVAVVGLLAVATTLEVVEVGAPARG